MPLPETKASRAAIAAAGASDSAGRGEAVGDGLMAHLRMDAAHAAIYFPVDDEAAAEAGADGEVKHLRITPFRVVILGQGGEVGIDIDAKGALVFFLHQLLERDFFPSWLVEGNDAGLPIERAACGCAH